MSDLEVQLRPGEESAIKGSVDAAHEAFTAGDYDTARYHLNNAKQTLVMSMYNAGSLRRVLTEAQAHMSNKVNSPAGASVLDRVMGESPGHNTGPGGIIRHNTSPDVLNLPVQADLAEPVVRFLEHRQAKREAKAKARNRKPPKLPKLLLCHSWTT